MARTRKTTEGSTRRAPAKKASPKREVTKKTKGGGSLNPRRSGAKTIIKNAKIALKGGQIGAALADLKEGQSIEVAEGTIQLIPKLDFDWAQLLLSNLHPLQRKPRQLHVDAIARALVAGKYEFTGDSIKIDQHARLIDGQHRCLAVLQANVPIQQAILMTINSDVAYRYIDTVHKVRGQADIWRFMGHSDSIPGSVVSAIIFEHSNFKRDLGLTRPEKYEIVRDYKFLNEAIELYKCSHYKNRVPAGPLGGALRCMKKNRVKALDFFGAAFSNSHLVQGEYASQAKLLATWILASRMEKGKSAGEPFKVEGANKAIRAWNAWREGRSIRVLTRGDGIPKAR